MRKNAAKRRRRTAAPQNEAARVKRLHTNTVRRILSLAGFQRVSDVAEKEFIFDDRKTDLDDVYIYENIVLVAEYTAAQPANIGDHLRTKKIVYDKILDKPREFVEFLRGKFPSFETALGRVYHDSKVIVKILYCSRYDFDESHRTNAPGPVYLGYPQLRYFSHVTDAVRRSARFELLNFLDIPLAKVGQGGDIQTADSFFRVNGFILPEAHSNFADGFKIVSFYANAGMLLRTAYVMRKDGWRDSENLYQRMVRRSKIEGIRTYLKTQKRVFINNIIVTLPSEAQPLDSSGRTVDVSQLTDAAPVAIKLPDRANSIGIIDGQHRIFAYHETNPDEEELARLRKQQNLLVTGIIYPPNLSDLERERFEARLFLEINSNQTSADPQIKQAIGAVIDPFSTDSIATKVIRGLARQGPLAGIVQEYFWEGDKLRTASIVSYGLRPLVKMGGTDSLFRVWPRDGKDTAISEQDGTKVSEYVAFCVSEINKVLGAFRANLGAARWTADKSTPNKVVSTTYINSFLIVMRLLIENEISLSPADLAQRLKNVNSFNFSNYKSSHYRQMAEEIVRVYFGVTQRSGRRRG